MINTSRYRTYLHSDWLKNSEHQTYVELSLTFAAILFFFWFALRPTLNTISQLNGDKAVLEEVNGKLESKIDNLAAAQVVYEKAEPQLEVLNEALPADSLTEEFLAQLEMLGVRSKVNLTNVTFSKYDLNKTENPEIESSSQINGQPNYPWQQVKFNLTAEGEYANLQTFTTSITKLRRVILLDTVSIASSTEDLGSQQLKLIVDGRVIYY